MTMKKATAIITITAFIGGVVIGMATIKTEEGALALILTAFTIGAIVTKSIK